MKSITYISAIMLLATTACSKNQADDQQSTPDIDVASVVVDSVTIYKEFPGTLKANNSVDLVARVSGYVTSQNYENGQWVHKGDLLFTIEDTKYRDAVAQARANLATAQANHQYAVSQYNAMKKALESDAVAEMEVNKAKSTVDQYVAAINDAQAALQTALTNLSYCRVTAPFDGHVGVSAVGVGAFVNGEGSPVTLATIYGDEQLYAEFYVDDKTMQEIENAGKLNEIDFNNIPLHFNQDVTGTYNAKLIFVAPEVNSQTGAMMLRALVDNTHGDLHDGMYVTINLPSMTDPKAMLVSDAAISTDQLGKYLYVVDSLDKVVYTPVTTGEMVGDSLRIVTKGVRPNDRYVTRALLKVRDGMKIHPVSATKTSTTK